MFATLSKGYHDFIAQIRKPQAQPQDETTEADPHIFFTLPPEIRHQIYRLLIVPRDGKCWMHTSKLALLECTRRLYRDPPYSETFNLVSRLTISRNMNAYDINDILPRFPALWEVELNLGTAAHRGAVLLQAVRGQLERIDRVILVFLIKETVSLVDPLDALRKEYGGVYDMVLDLPEGYLEKQKMSQEYQAPKGIYSVLRDPATLRLTFERNAAVLGRRR